MTTGTELREGADAGGQPEVAAGKHRPRAGKVIYWPKELAPEELQCHNDGLRHLQLLSRLYSRCLGENAKGLKHSS